MPQPTNGSAQAAFQAQAAAAGINLAGLDLVSQIQWVLANLLGAGSATFPGNITVNGTLIVKGGIATAANGIEPMVDGAGAIGTALLRFDDCHIIDGNFSTITATGIGSATGTFSTGAADTGGSGFRLVRVPN